MDSQTLTIIIPVFNELANLDLLFTKLASLSFIGWDLEMLVIDDASRDGSTDWLKQHQNFRSNLKVLFQEKNLGKGAAVKIALGVAKGEYVVILDADNEYEPKEIELLLNHLTSNNVVFGKRTERSGWHGYWFFVLGNYLMNLCMSAVSGVKIKDAYTGFKLMPKKTWESLDIQQKGFAMEAEITAKLLKQKIKIDFVDISYKPRTFKQGKKITIKDGFIGFWVFLQNYFS